MENSMNVSGHTGTYESVGYSYTGSANSFVGPSGSYSCYSGPSGSYSYTGPSGSYSYTGSTNSFVGPSGSTGNY